MRREFGGINKMVRAGYLVTVLLAAALLMTGCGSETAAAPEPVTGENYFLDTVCTISIYEIRDDTGENIPATDDEERAQDMIRRSWDLCAELDKTLSRTQDASEISAVNRAHGEWTEVSRDTVKLTAEGVRYSGLSDGDFDITIGGVTDLWDFHADPEHASLPDEDALKEAVKHVDYKNIEIKGNKLRIRDPEAKIDLGGIAKGYIGDRLTDLLSEEGAVSAIINLGGNVICIGGKGSSSDSGDGDFLIGVEAPYSDRSEIVGTVRARDMTLVTSGVYERQIEVDGRKYHHILSTETGYPVETDLDAVTLIGPSGKSMDLDALSTICLIKGYDKARELIDAKEGIEAVFIKHDGTIEQTEGAGFEQS